jgi:hypothetical protein
LTVSACGGGGGSGPNASGTITPAPALRKDLLFGYFAGVSANVVDVAGHCNLFWAAMSNDGGLDQMASLVHAKGAGIKNVVLDIPAYFAKGGPPVPESELRFWLKRLADGKNLDNVVAVCPIDEPNHQRNGARSDAEVTAQNALLRRILPDYGLGAAKLAVIYSSDSGRPGLASYDWLGIDDYGRGCSIMAATDELKRSLPRADQRLLVVPGGSSPWKQDPACFESYAHGEPRVVACTPFAWQTVVDGETYAGIRENGMRACTSRPAGRSSREGLAPHAALPAHAALPGRGFLRPAWRASSVHHAPRPSHRPALGRRGRAHQQLRDDDRERDLQPAIGAGAVLDDAYAVGLVPIVDDPRLAVERRRQLAATPLRTVRLAGRAHDAIAWGAEELGAGGADLAAVGSWDAALRHVLGLSVGDDRNVSSFKPDVLNNCSATFLMGFLMGTAVKRRPFQAIPASVLQSDRGCRKGLIIPWSLVRVQAGPPIIKHLRHFLRSRVFS